MGRNLWKVGSYFRVIGPGMMFVLWLFVPPVLAEPDFLVKEIALAKDVENRNPGGVFTPPAYCEKDKNGQAAIPVVDMSHTSQVVFWVKVAAITSGELRHSWHHQIDGTWAKISEVTLPIRPSSGYRMWSLKSLRSDRHTGEWMVVIAPSHEPEQILCITRFTVQ